MCNINHMEKNHLQTQGYMFLQQNVSQLCLLFKKNRFPKKKHLKIVNCRQTRPQIIQTTLLTYGEE